MTAPFSFFTPRPAPGPYRQAPALLPDLSTSAPRPSDIERALVSGQLDPEARAQMAAQVQAENAQTAHNAPRSLLGGALQNITIPLSLLSIPTSPLGARSVLAVREATNKAVGADPNAPGADLMELLGGFAPVGPELLATRGVARAATATRNRVGLLAKALGLPDPLAAVRPDVGPLKGMLERIAAPEVLPEAMNAVQRELSDAKGYATRVLGDPEASPELVQTALTRLEDAHLQHELAGGGFTYDPRTRQLVPKEGFAVANPPGAQSVDRSMGTVGTIREAMQRNAELLRQPDMMLGGWTDQKVGRDMIEVSQVRADLEEAMALARQRGEKAVWDLAAGREIPVDYTKAAPNSAVQTVVSDYLRARPELAGARLPDVPRVDEARASQMAGVYARLKSDPANPEVQRAYRALVDETKAQYQALQDAGYRFEFVDEDPYKSSAEMTRDLRENRRLRVFKSKEGDHPLLSPEENTIFRAVHDAIGHGAGGSQFGPHGEELAYRKHAAMFSPLARRAMATETRGQNSWVNFGPHRALPPAQRPFAEQKAALWPEEFLGDYGDMPTETPLWPEEFLGDYGDMPTETPADPTSWVDRLGQMLYDPGRMGMGLGGARTAKPIRAAAVRGPDGRIFEGITHQFARDAAAEAGVKIRASDNAAAGFVTQDGRFVTRDQALQLSIAEGQSSQMPSEKDLYAEDILDPEAKALSRERAIEGPSPERLAKSRGLLDRLGQTLYDPGRMGMGLGGAGRRRAPMKLNSTRTLPLSDLLTSSRSMREAQADIAAGRGSRTKGPVHVRRTEDGRLLVTDGQHRLAEAAARGDRTISVKLTGEGYSDYWATPRKGEEWTPPAVAKPKTDRPFRAAGVVAVNKKGERRIFEGAIHPQAAYKAARAGFRVDPDAEALGHNGFVLQDGTYVSRADAPKHLKKGEVPKAERLKMGEEPADPLSDFQLDSIPTPARRRRSAPQVEGLSLLHPDGSETRTVPTPLGPMTGTIPPKPGRLPNGLAPDRFFQNDYFFGTPEGVREPRRRYGYETNDAIYDIVVDQGGERTYLRNGKVVEPHRIHRAVEQQYGLPAEGPLAPEHRHDAPVEGHLRLMTDSIPSGTAPKPEGLLDRLGRALYDPGRMGMGLGSLRAERWVPEPRGIFDRSAPKLQGTAPIPPEMQASMSRGSVSPLVDALISSPKVRAGLREDVEQGLEIGGVPWYELGPVKASFDAMLREGDPVSFLDFLNLTGSASIQNPTHNELASYSALLRALEDGSTFDAAKRTIRAANPSFAAPWGTEGMLANAAQARARGNQFPSSPGSASRKVAWYTHGKRGGSRLADVALDTHERRRFAQLAARSRSAYRQLKLAGAAGPNDVIPIVNALDYTALSEPYRELAKEFDLPSAQAAQASRWLGGGKHTGLRSKPTGDYVQILEDAVLATAKATGRPTDPEALQQLWWDIVQGRQAAAPRYHAAQ